MSLDFTGTVALVTGAGNGLGKVYAQHLAERGARVVVNDIAVDEHGRERSDAPAERVVAEIRAAGGVAVACAESVATPGGGAAMVARAIEEFGDLDIVVNNAGIARTNFFTDVSYPDVIASLSVHLLGAYHVLLPAWKHLVERGGGRVVNTTSAVGIFGQRRSAVYASGKMGIVGLTRVLAQEGAAHGIRVNAIAPVASSRMAGSVYGELDRKVPPELVSAVVLALTHPSCEVTGEVISAGGGRMSRLVIGATEGYFSPHLDDEEAAHQLAGVCTQDVAVDLPDSAMSEIDLIRQCFPDLEAFPMQPR
ncbi:MULTISPECIES: SDR family NAD(P)-dependent oxidoreductase [unclassified Nocardioides]|uniref:SDR family NAD(P)-dependent oxidoreductase n=1 Tax=unclassified Nocardioides TaxID=2615069 RepID=UPI00361DF05B